MSWTPKRLEEHYRNIAIKAFSKLGLPVPKTETIDRMIKSGKLSDLFGKKDTHHELPEYKPKGLTYYRSPVSRHKKPNYISLIIELVCVILILVILCYRNTTYESDTKEEKVTFSKFSKSLKGTILIIVLLLIILVSVYRRMM